MFGRLFGPPKCPVDEQVQQWVDMRWHWLCDTFGRAHLQSARVILPRHEDFPDDYDANDLATIRQLFDRVCEYMGLTPNRIEFGIYTAEKERIRPFTEIRLDAGAAVGLYERIHNGCKVWVAEQQLDDPMSLVATCAHELAHELLLGQERITNESADHEPLTDLLTIYLGLGIFGANAAVTASSGFDGGVSFWKVGRQGYLDLRTFGYALSLFARMRGEVKPAWAKELRLDVRDSFRKGLAFLAEQDDPRFRPLWCHGSDSRT
jgi:hypothetical protein